MNNLPEPVRSIVDDLNDLKDPILASAVESLCLSKDFHNLSSLELLNQLLLPVCEQKLDNRFKGRLDKAHLSGCPQTIDNCKDSSERTYLPTDIVSTLSTLSFIEEGLNICIQNPCSFLTSNLIIQQSERIMTSPIRTKSHHLIIEKRFKYCF